MWRDIALGAGGLILCAAVCGCDFGTSRLLTADRLSRGETIVLPGIEGRGFLNRGIRGGLADGGVPTAIEIYDWTVRFPILGAVVNQMWESRARDKGRELAEEITLFKRHRPGAPVFLVGHSGGCAVAVFAAESMGRESIDGVILLAPSISPDYDLTRALRHVSGEVVSYYSPRDVALLGVGTVIFGTVDREHTSSAGRVGFFTPTVSGTDAAVQYRKLRQVPWTPAMGMSGNHGGHTGWADRRFVRDYIAPQIKQQMQQLADRRSAAVQASGDPRGAAATRPGGPTSRPGAAVPAKPAAPVAAGPPSSPLKFPGPAPIPAPPVRPPAPDVSPVTASKTPTTRPALAPGAELFLNDRAN